MRPGGAQLKAFLLQPGSLRLAGYALDRSGAVRSEQQPLCDQVVRRSSGESRVVGEVAVTLFQGQPRVAGRFALRLSQSKRKVAARVIAGITLAKPLAPDIPTGIS